MKIMLKKPVTHEEVNELLIKEFPEYNVKIRKNPLFKFRLVQVKKSAFIGVWIHVKKDFLIVESCIPSDVARGLFGGIFVRIFTYSITNRISKEVGEYLASKVS